MSLEARQQIIARDMNDNVWSENAAMEYFATNDDLWQHVPASHYAGY